MQSSLRSPVCSCNSHNSRPWARIHSGHRSSVLLQQHTFKRACRNTGLPCQAIFGFGNKKEAPATTTAEKREYYSAVDVEHYFNYMGMLAEEGTYDKLNRLQETGLEPVDLLLVMAAAENDAPKVGELLRAGADTHVKGPEGKTPIELASNEEVLGLLRNPSEAQNMDFA